MYISDGGNNRIRKVNTAGTISTIAGDGMAGSIGDGGPATSAELNFPGQLAIDGSDNLYVADASNYAIRKIDGAGVITTVVGCACALGDGGPATTAGLNNPYGLAFDGSGNMYIGDAGHHRIRKVNTAGIISTIVGDDTAGYSGDGGPGTAARINDNTAGLTVDAAGNVYIADGFNQRIRKIDVSGIITTIAGNGTSGSTGDGGPATDARLAGPSGIVFDGAGNLYIVDQFNNKVRKVTYSSVPNSVESTSVGKLTVTPNPSYSGYYSISVPIVGNEKAHIVVSDEMGRQVLEMYSHLNGSGELYINNRGIYFLNVTTSTGQWFTKLIR